MRSVSLALRMIGFNLYRIFWTIQLHIAAATLGFHIRPPPRQLPRGRLYPCPHLTFHADPLSTVTIVETTYVPQQGGTVTVPESTVTSTVTEGPPAMRKRQAMNSTSVTIMPVASISSMCQVSPGNSSLINSISSACACLFITESTETIPVTLTTVR